MKVVDDPTDLGDGGTGVGSDRAEQALELFRCGLAQVGGGIGGQRDSGQRPDTMPSWRSAAESKSFFLSSGDHVLARELQRSRGQRRVHGDSQWPGQQVEDALVGGCECLLSGAQAHDEVDVRAERTPDHVSGGRSCGRHLRPIRW